MDKLRTELESFKRHTQYYETHREGLLNQYPEQWVSIFDEEVVGASPDFEQLLTDLEGKGVPIDRALFKYVTRKEELWILYS